MILNLSARNVNDAYVSALVAFNGTPITPVMSRAGPVYRYPTPVMLEYKCPEERVLFDPTRDANPFFHMMEGLWMLAGEQNFDWLTQFNDGIQQFSDDKKTLHGAYGYRWRHHFGYDQITDVIEHLRTDPLTRRVVISMYDPTVDSFGAYRGKDVPCNTQLYFSVRGQYLDMTIMARSNDLVWGALGANAVHMSMLHEFIARQCDMSMGSMYQFSNDYHIYAERFSPSHLYMKCKTDQPYKAQALTPVPICHYDDDPKRWLSQCLDFVRGQWDSIDDMYLLNTAIPMKQTYDLYIAGGTNEAIEHSRHIAGPDWREACRQWLGRRKNV